MTPTRRQTPPPPAGSSQAAHPAVPRLVALRGSVAEVAPLAAGLHELVRVGRDRLFGEVVRIRGDACAVQVYEETEGLCLGDRVEATGAPLRVHLGPGLLGSVLDGIGRPLARLAEDPISGALDDFLRPGADAPTLPAERVWPLEPRRTVGEAVAGGDVVATTREGGVEHPVLVPPGVAGRIVSLETGDGARVGETVARLDDGSELRLGQWWPVRRPRPVARRLLGDRPLLTGQRVFDFLFPLAEGGSVAVPGGFGTGKTVVEQSLARHARADVVVFVGCGERGNEMAEAIEELSALVDPRTGRSLRERTVLIVNTSNMPVVAREASIYLGMTVAEYYRDLGLRTVLLVDSLSRWAEALREIASHLGEMPGEEGYPAYLPDRLGKFYERAGAARVLGAPERTGSVTLISAVSPPGGDLSEPVTQASLRAVGGLWALDAALAHARQFPAVSWRASYSLDAERLQNHFARSVSGRWPELRRQVFDLLQREADLREIASLVGADALQDPDRLRLEAGALVREHLLGQNAFDERDASSSPAKTLHVARLCCRLLDEGLAVLQRGGELDALDLTAVRRAVLRVRQSADAEVDAAAGRADAELAALFGSAEAETAPERPVEAAS